MQNVRFVNTQMDEQINRNQNDYPFHVMSTLFIPRINKRTLTECLTEVQRWQSEQEKENQKQRKEGKNKDLRATNLSLEDGVLPAEEAVDVKGGGEGGRVLGGGAERLDVGVARWEEQAY